MTNGDGGNSGISNLLAYGILLGAVAFIAKQIPVVWGGQVPAPSPSDITSLGPYLVVAFFVFVLVWCYRNPQ